MSLDPLDYFPEGAPVVALPNWQTPRLLFIAGDKSHNWRQAAHFPAYRLRARLFRGALQVMAALGATALRRGGGRGVDPLNAFLADRVTDVIAVIGRDATQRLTLLARTSRARCAVKLGFAAAAASELAHEHAVLEALPRGIAPRVVRWGKLGESSALATTYIDGDAPPACLPAPAALYALLRLLMGTQTHAVVDHPGLHGVGQRVGTLPEWIRDVLSQCAWPCAIQHGDLAPWNLLKDRNGRYWAIDWEHGCVDGVPYVDLAHYALQTAALVYHWSPGVAVTSAVAHLRDFEPRLSAPQAAAFVALAAMLAQHTMRSTEHNDWRSAVVESAHVAAA